MKLLLLAASALLLLAAGEPDEHMVERGPDRATPTTASIAARRLDEMASRLKLANVGATRLAIYDIAWPADREEFEGLGRNGVLQVSAVAADAKELPVTRVYVRYEGGEIDLKRLTVRRFDVPPAAAAHAIGAFREDSYWLLPMGLADQRGMVLIDFSAHRQEFDLAGLPLNPPSFPANAGVGRVDGPVLAAFVKREFKEAPALAP